MALRRTLCKRLFCAANPDSPSPITSLAVPADRAAKGRFCRDSGGYADLFHNFLQRRAISDALPSFLGLSVGEKLRKRLKPMAGHVGGRCVPSGQTESLRAAPVVMEGLRVGAADLRKVLRLARIGQIRERLRSIPASTVAYGEFVRVCFEVCGDREVALEIAKTLDECGNVIVLGGVVFLHPDQVVKSVETLISQSISWPNDPRRKELENLEIHKARINQKAESMVRAELYCGLGFMVLQSLGFMRLTFWELSWDVMEPICFFVASAHFALAYAFFLRTWTEPSFEGYFQRRFKVKQRKLMKIHNFDVERYNQLCQTFYPNSREQYGYKNIDPSIGRLTLGSVHG